MNSRTRVISAAKGIIPDVLPVSLYMANHCSAASGFALGDCYRDGKKLAKAQYRGWEIYGQDVVTAQADNYYMAEAFGAEVRHYPDSTPTLKRALLERPADVVKLLKPDPRKDGRMAVYLEAIELLKSMFGDEVAIRGCGTGPFVMAGHLLGTEAFLLELARAHYGLSENEAALMEIMDLSCETLIDFAAEQLKAGAAIVQLADSTASLDMISPEMYEKFVLPHEKKFFSAINPLCEKFGGVSLLHICGDNTKVFHLYGETGAQIVEVDHKADLETAKKIMGTKVCISGNLDPTGCLLQGSPDDVECAVRECIEKASFGGGYMLGSGCEVPIKTPGVNVKTAISTARQYRYANERCIKDGHE